MLKIPLLVSLGHHGGQRKVASLRPPFSTPLRSLGEPDPDTPFLVPIEHAPPLFVRIWEDKISLKIPPPPLLASPCDRGARRPRLLAASPRPKSATSPASRTSTGSATTIVTTSPPVSEPRVQLASDEELFLVFGFGKLGRTTLFKRGSC